MKVKVLTIPSVGGSADSELPFYIPATSSLHERRPRTLKHDDSFGLFDHYGDIVWTIDSPEGLYHEDTRYLSGFEFRFAGRRPLLLGSTVQNNNCLLIADLTNPDIYADGHLHLPRDTIHMIRSKFLWRAGSYERIALKNFHDEKQTFEVGFDFGADFSDIFEVRGHKRSKRGELSAEVCSPDTVRLSYLGLDGVERWTTIRFDPKPDRLDEQSASFDIDLAPKERRSLFSTVTFNDERGEKPNKRRFFVVLREARRELRRSASRAASVESSNEILNEVIARAASDHHMLLTDTAEGPYPYAGIPWFNTTFGRDGIITAMETLWMDPGVARGVLRFQAARQSTESDPVADAEPGKIFHEIRSGEMAELGEVPFRRYYGGVDTTPLFVVLAGMYHERTGDLETVSELWPHIEAALKWIDVYGDSDGDGFIEYARQTDKGLANQGWKDSHDSVFHADGSLATGPIALCEVQGYVYAAKKYGANIARAIGRAAAATRFEQEAATLKARFEESFWNDDLGFYALALDGDKKQCAVRTSNAGHLLFTGIAEPDRAVRVADVLMGPDFFSGWGIRTVAETESRYNPMSYHNGSIWPHDNALIALGMARYGLMDHIERLFVAIFDTASQMDLRRLPELFCGFRRIYGKGPTFYPVACAPQAWSCATPFAFLQACLGLEFDPVNEAIRLRHPRLPPFVEELTIRALRLGGTSVDLLLRKHQSDVSVNVLQKSGDGTVSITL